jgi:hypothetical protein
LENIFLGVVYTFGCKKYPEDDVFMQWKKPEKRLMKYGPWIFDKLTVDGVDKSAEFKLDTAYFNEIRFIEPALENGPTLGIDRPEGFHDEFGGFELLNKNSELELGIVSSYINHSDYHNYGPLFVSGITVWKILRLSKKGLTLSVEYNSSEYILYLKTEN